MGKRFSNEKMRWNILSRFTLWLNECQLGVYPVSSYFRGDVSSFRLPAMEPDVFIGTLLGQASLHSVDRTGKYCQVHFSTEGVKPGVGVGFSVPPVAFRWILEGCSMGYNIHALRYR